MTNKLKILKKRLIYRASYRGTKEMDVLLASFVNKCSLTVKYGFTSSFLNSGIFFQCLFALTFKIIVK